MKITTNFDYPPIPYRGCDWSAIDADSYDGQDTDPIGHGATEQEAVADLLEQLDLRAEGASHG